MDDGTRTHDDWNHNPGLYQLSYTHHKTVKNRSPPALQIGAPDRNRTCNRRLRRPVLYPVELRAPILHEQDSRATFLFGRGREIRTPDILLPKQARYQTALYPDYTVSFRVANLPALWSLAIIRAAPEGVN